MEVLEGLTMLVELRVGNHRSVRDEQVLTMAAGRVGAAADPRPRRVAGHDVRLLPVAALYGANACGKSNLLAAAAFVRAAVVDSHRRWQPDGGVPREPFAWGPHTGAPSLYEVTILVDGTRYEYGFVVDDERFVEEWLYAWPRGRKQVWLAREGNDFKFGDRLRGENRLIAQVTRPNALFLSAAAQHQHQQLLPVYRWFSGLRMVGVRGRHRRGFGEMPLELWLSRVLADRDRVGIQTDLFPEDDGKADVAEALRTFLRAADVGIIDVKLAEDDDDELARRGHGRGPRVLLRHRSSTGLAWLPLDEESQGTLTLLRMVPPLLGVLAGGGVLVVDELEASLHPLLGLEVVRQFNDPTSNPHNAQLLFTTHDTNLLGSLTGDPPLRRDQIWLTEKDQEGATSLCPLTDYRPRKAENLERGYLQGRYGAVPIVGFGLGAAGE